MTIEKLTFERHLRQNAIDTLKKYNEERKKFLTSIGIKPSKDLCFCMAKTLISCFIAENEAIQSLINDERIENRNEIDRMMRGNYNKYGGKNL